MHNNLTAEEINTIAGELLIAVIEDHRLTIMEVFLVLAAASAQNSLALSDLKRKKDANE